MDRPWRQGSRRRPRPRHDARPVRTVCHPAARLARRGRRQAGGADRRHHPQAAARPPGRRQPLLHDAQLQQAEHHPQHQDRARQGDPHRADPALRRPGRELRPRRGRPAWASPGSSIQEINPRLVYASIKGFGDGPVHQLQGVRGRRAGHGRLDERPPASRTGRRWRPARRSATRAPASTPSPASSPRSTSASSTGRGQRVNVAMQHAVLNLCRVKLRDQQRLAHGPLAEYPNEDFGDEVPALRQRLRRRPARLGGQVRARRPQRLRLRHRAARRAGSRSPSSSAGPSWPRTPSGPRRRPGCPSSARCSS